MIAWLSGITRWLGGDHVVLDVQGVGYQVFVHERDAETARLNEPLVLHIRMTVREDALTLYGFSNPADREVYDALTAVPGVGPKAAMALLSLFGYYSKESQHMRSAKLLYAAVTEHAESAQLLEGAHEGGRKHRRTLVVAPA